MPNETKTMEPEAAFEYVMGIDLGTSNSCVGIWGPNGIEIVQNVNGKRTMPSMILFGPNGKIDVGEAAVEKLGSAPTKVIRDVKRIIGRPPHDPKLQGHMKNCRVESDEFERAVILVPADKRPAKMYYPE